MAVKVLLALALVFALVLAFALTLLLVGREYFLGDLPISSVVVIARGIRLIVVRVVVSMASVGHGAEGVNGKMGSSCRVVVACAERPNGCGTRD